MGILNLRQSIVFLLVLILFQIGNSLKCDGTVDPEDECRNGFICCGAQFCCESDKFDCTNDTCESKGSKLLALWIGLGCAGGVLLAGLIYLIKTKPKNDNQKKDNSSSINVELNQGNQSVQTLAYNSHRDASVYNNTAQEGIQLRSAVRNDLELQSPTKNKTRLY